ERNNLSKLGITGLLMLGAIMDVTISGNKFVDISGGGMNIADGSLHPENLKNVIIKNNYIRNIGVEYLSSTGISVAQGKNIYIGHNEISYFAYIGIHMAWHSRGTNVEHITIENNYIHDYFITELHDGGGIYALGPNPLGNAENPAYTVRGNYIRNQLNHNAPLYPDNGSTWWLAEKNVIDIKDSPHTWAKNRPHQSLLTNQGENLKITNNYVTTDTYIDRGKNNTYQWNLYSDAVWPREAINIISNAGLEEPYYDLWDIDERFNVIMNPGFETRQENVWHPENAKWSRTTGEHYRGSTSAKITSTEAGGLIDQKINVQKGLHYTVSVWIKKESESSLPAALYAKSVKGEKSVLQKLDEKNIPKGKWTLLQGEFDFSGNGISDSVTMFVQANAKAGESYYLDEFRVIEKNEADKKMLRKAIKSARKTYDQAVEGEKPGEYAPGSKTEFLAGIRDAETAIGVISDKQQLYKALKSLYSNQVWFKNKCNNLITFAR
ncbi:MAG: carbohydrate binding domain-containing protein, partial [Bacteroidales bacterium]